MPSEAGAWQSAATAGASARALRSARSELVADVDDAWLEASTRDAFHFELFRKLNPVSMMIVPLVARGRTLGAIVLMSAESGRRYTDTDLALAEDLYDQAGELWKIWINDMSFRKKAFDGASVIEYPDEMGFIPAIVMVDMQLEHATRASLPSGRFAGEQGWYFNQGEKAGVTDDWFTVAALVAAGH